jgi:hypothetical protein
LIQIKGRGDKRRTPQASPTLACAPRSRDGSGRTVEKVAKVVEAAERPGGCDSEVTGPNPAECRRERKETPILQGLKRALSATDLSHRSATDTLAAVEQLLIRGLRRPGSWLHCLQRLPDEIVGLVWCASESSGDLGHRCSRQGAARAPWPHRAPSPRQAAS